MAEQASEKVVLDHDVTINGQTYPAGTQEVPKELAEDLRRINGGYTKHLLDRNRDNGFTQRMKDMAVGKN